MHRARYFGFEIAQCSAREAVAAFGRANGGGLGAQHSMGLLGLDCPPRLITGFSPKIGYAKNRFWLGILN